MTEQEQITRLGIICMFIGGILTITGIDLLSTLSLFSHLLTISPEDFEYALPLSILFFGLLFDIIGIYLYYSAISSRDQRRESNAVLKDE
jgi:hypothetical protein